MAAAAILNSVYRP